MKILQDGFVKHDWKYDPALQKYTCLCHGISYTEKEYIERCPPNVHGNWALNIMASVDLAMFEAAK